MSQPADAGLNPLHGAPHSAVNEAAHDEHSSFIKTPQQLLVVLLLSFVVPIIGILLLVYFVVNEHRAATAFEPASVSARMQPVGTVVVVDANAPRVEKTGEEVVKAVCGACHTTGAANAPKIGDKGSWGSRLSMGLAGLTQSAIVGKGAMPPRGGVADLSDLEIARSIVVMANQSGASFKEPPEPPVKPVPVVNVPKK